MSATLLWSMPRSIQYRETNHCLSDFVPLLELQESQHLTTLSEIIDWSLHLALLMCSHVPLVFLSVVAERSVSFTPQ
jgi:hypothetical protein